MPPDVRTSLIASAGQRLRDISLSAPPGQRLGSEDDLLARLNVSRGTLRQAARLLEREGLLSVRRGPNGGYYGARPDAATIEATMSAHLHSLGMDAGDVTVVASALWVEALRKAAAVEPGRSAPILAPLVARLTKLDPLKLDPGAGATVVRAIDTEIREAVFALADCRYIALIFRINLAFAERHFPPPAEPGDAATHARFVTRWRAAKLLELGAIAAGDGALAAMAGRHGREIWDEHIVGRYGQASA